MIMHIAAVLSAHVCCCRVCLEVARSFNPLLHTFITQASNITHHLSYNGTIQNIMMHNEDAYNDDIYSSSMVVVNW